ncbi:MAG TPA: alpha-2-macroglobulin family protein [Candidatus Sumerlaeota bacterium]|nr:alpha-2-macroglobulin family protein [Candidatus Sumerlaeota bacterium]
MPRPPAQTPAPFRIALVWLTLILICLLVADPRGVRARNGESAPPAAAGSIAIAPPPPPDQPVEEELEVEIPADATPQDLLERANALHAEGSFRLARAWFAALRDRADAPAALRDEAALMYYDSLWRERGIGVDVARDGLRRLMNDLPADSLLRARAAESLARLIQQFDAWRVDAEHLEPWLVAIKIYGESADVATARPRYLQLNLDLAEHLLRHHILPVPKEPHLQALGILPPPPPENEPWRNDLVTWAARNVLKVADAPEQRAQALLLLGRLHLESWVPDEKARETWQAEAEGYFKQVIEIEPRTPWHDDALWLLAQWYNQRARYTDAAATADRFLELYERGESEYYDAAVGLRDEIRTPRIDLGAGRAFVPRSYIHLHIAYRNVSEAAVRIERIAPEPYLQSRTSRLGMEDDPPPGELVLEQALTGLVDKGDHAPGSHDEFLAPLAPGIYRASIRSPQVDAELRPTYFLVSTVSVAIKQAQESLVAFVADAETGQPVAGADVWFRWRIHTPNRNDTRYVQEKGVTDEQGLARAKRPAIGEQESYGSTLVLALKDGQPAAVESWSGYFVPRVNQPWAQLYAYSDRPAYRPGEPIQWKAILRYRTEKEWLLPEQPTAWVVIRDARQQVAYEGEHRFSDYGTLAGTFAVDRTAALGMLQLQLFDKQGGSMLAGAALCRVEEYKLPEFKVSVEPPAEQVQFGRELAFAIAAEYYFGGPVAGGAVEVVVHRRPFYPWWRPPMPYPWLWEDGGYRAGGPVASSFMFWPRVEPEVVVLTETLELDEQGRARVVVPALSDEERMDAEEREIWGYSYRVEARVVDASRREVTGEAAVKVARTAFAAYLNPQRYLYLPGDTAKIEIKTLDPNDQPVSTEARVTIHKREWNATKVNDDKTTGGYDDTELFTRTIRTGADGMHLFEFQPEQTGVYLVKLDGRDRFGAEVTAETNLFVADRDTTQTGYRSGGVEIITDKESYERGETAQVLLIVRRAGAVVWFAVESEGIHEQRVERVDGTSRLLAIPITQEHEPNIYLTALAMFDYSAFQTSKRIVVPPARRFLNVEIDSGKEELRPGETTTVRVKTTNHAGEPVSAEISLGVADQAVWAIQNDLVGDIRQAFWSETRGLAVQTQASASQYTIEYWQPRPGKPGEFEAKRREDIPAEARDAAAGGIAADSDVYFARPRLSKGGERMALAEAMPAPTAQAAGLAFDALGMEAGGEGQPPRLRTDFSSTALWLAQVVTGADGAASATLTMPDSLTTWNVTSKALDRETRVGEQRTTVVTNKPIMIRPQAPRYFVEGDEATVSAIINNNTTDSQQIKVSASVTGLTLSQVVDQLTPVDYRPADPSTEPVRAYHAEITVGIPAGGQRRVDWTVTADAPGSATITLRALNPIDSDAVEKSYPVLEYGIEQFIAGATSIRDAATTEPTAAGETLEKTITLNIPAERKEASEGLTIWLEPTLARAMVNALPYLADYPYGCVEQTLSRFVPAVITQRVVAQLGLSLPNLEEKLPDMIQVGLKRLDDAQHDDGGWGWWPQSGSDLYMTAYVVQGLAQARGAGVDVKPDVIRRGAEFLLDHVVEARQPDLTAFVLYAVASADVAPGNAHLAEAAYERLWPVRQELNAYSRALFALACHLSGRAEWTEILARNMYNDVRWDKENGTASWGSQGFYWRWSDGPIEATAFSLRALLAIDPDHELIDPAMTWLVRNRRGNRWKNTRDTAFAISALAEYILARGENAPDWTAEVRVNGQPVGSFTATGENVFSFEGQIVVDPALLRTGENTVTIRRRGTGALYASAWLTYFTREKPIPPAANEIEVERRYFRVRQQETAAGEYKEVREPIAEGATLRSGDRVEVELRLDAKNVYEYIVIEDMKAAGMEPVDVQSGWTWGEGLAAHRELRDEKTAFFVDHMPQGEHTLKYTLRAETPGVFQALPTLVHAMYIPEIRANSASGMVRIEDAPVEPGKPGRGAASGRSSVRGARSASTITAGSPPPRSGRSSFMARDLTGLWKYME